ncbi:MAG: AAA family ATPase, partial [Atribacterota bacterium]|nr:AAA family ATPase [Atribacterota bacterium]
MRIKTLTLKPFAGISDRTLQFSPGLNIITGPNEAGKSTLLQALEAVLFTPVELSKAKYEKLIKNYLPASGGNIIRVYLTFQSADKEFHLKKEWKAGGKDGVCIIRSEVDGEYTGDKEVSEYFSQYLPAKEGTIKNILLTWQSALDRTKDVFNGNGQDVRSDLGNILRSSIMETDGVSVDKLKEKITQEYKDYFDHWDITKNEPENRRGINNPYTREVGKILKAYYEKENITRDYTLAVQIEEEIDSINDEIKIKEEKQAGIKDKLTKYESLKSPFIERQQIESEIKIISNQMENIIENSESWTIQENWLSNSAEIEIQKIEERISRLEKEKADIQTFLEHKGFRERFKKLKELFNNIRKADNQLSQVFPITREEIDILQEKKQQIEEIKKIITASKLRLLFKAKNLQKITTKDTTGLKEEHVVNKDQTFEKVFQGKLSIDQQDWSLEVQAGEGEIDVLLARQEK